MWNHKHSMKVEGVNTYRPTAWSKQRFRWASEKLENRLSKKQTLTIESVFGSQDVAYGSCLNFQLPSITSSSTTKTHRYGSWWWAIELDPLVLCPIEANHSLVHPFHHIQHHWSGIITSEIPICHFNGDSPPAFKRGDGNFKLLNFTNVRPNMYNWERYRVLQTIARSRLSAISWVMSIACSQWCLGKGSGQ